MVIAFESDREFARAPEAVWAALTDWSRAHEWLAGVPEMTASGPTEVGTVLTWRGPRGEQSSRILECDPPRALTLRSTAPGVVADYRYTLAESGTGTAMHLSADVETSGAMRLAGKPLRAAIARSDAGQLDALAALI